jgi:hypothetical protein
MATAKLLLLRALDLLRTALASTIRVGLSITPAEVPALTLTLPDDKTSTLRLIDPDTVSSDAVATTPTPWAWMVPRATAEQRQRWRHRSENFIDLSGAVSLRLPGLFVDRTDLEPARHTAPASSGRNTRSPFGDRASLVVRVLLDDLRRTWTTTALATAAGVSAPTVSLVVEALRNANLVRVGHHGRERAIAVANPVAVITEWARRYDWTRNAAVSFAAPIGVPERFLRRLPEVLGTLTTEALTRPARVKRHRRWALTLQAGASLIAPHAQWETTHLYVDADETDDLVEIGERAGWYPSAGGNLVLLLPNYRTSVWHGAFVKHGLPAVSQTQLILDLWNYPVRGREQAEHLMRVAGWFDSDA